MARKGPPPGGGDPAAWAVAAPPGGCDGLRRAKWCEKKSGKKIGQKKGAKMAGSPKKDI
jgi:hypothetical protein